MVNILQISFANRLLIAFPTLFTRTFLFCKNTKSIYILLCEILFFLIAHAEIYIYFEFQFYLIKKSLSIQKFKSTPGK